MQNKCNKCKIKSCQNYFKFNLEYSVTVIYLFVFLVLDVAMAIQKITIYRLIRLSWSECIHTKFSCLFSMIFCLIEGLERLLYIGAYASDEVEIYKTLYIQWQPFETTRLNLWQYDHSYKDRHLMNLAL